MSSMEQMCFWESAGRERTKGLAKFVCYMLAGFATR